MIAILFVASPFYLRGAIAAFEAIDGTLIDVAEHARSRPGEADAAGRGPARRAAGSARRPRSRSHAGIGEFGATILFAGSFQGTTQTLPLAVYSLFDANLDQAVAIGVLLIIVSAAILLASKLLRGHGPPRHRHRPPAARVRSSRVP